MDILIYRENMKYLKKYNEELSPRIYLNAANKLANLGHKRRPEELKKWAEEERKKNIISEAKKLGHFKFKVRDKIANYYPYFDLNKDELREQFISYREDNCSFWLPLEMGLIPVEEEDLEIIKEYSEYHSYDIVYWVQRIYLNISISISDIEKLLEDQTDNFDNLIKRSSYINYLTSIGFKGIGKGETIPLGRASIESGVYSEVYLADRLNANKFKKMLIDLFEDRIGFKNLGGEELLTEITANLCDLEEDPLLPEEFIRFIDSIRYIQVNTLYRD